MTAEYQTIFHICTKGFPDRLLFRDREDFIQGVNRTALSFNGLCSLAAVCLMSNHVHYIAAGDETDARKAIVKFKKTYGMWLSEKYGEQKVFRRWPHSIFPCTGSDYLKEAVSYVYKNPAGHSETNNPYYYPWSSVNIHFRDTKNACGTKEHSCISFKGMSKETSCLKQWEKKEILRTKDMILDTWSINPEGMVTFNSFIDTSIVESIFRTERSFNYFIQKRDKDISGRSMIRLDMEEEHLCCDASALKKAAEISLARFNTDDIFSLDARKKNEIRLELVIKYGTPDTVADRVFGMSSRTPGIEQY